MSGGQPGAEMDILVPISALEHFSYCPRQCALIHVEQTFDENVFTVRGRLSHERADLGETTAPGAFVSCAPCRSGQTSTADRQGRCRRASSRRASAGRVTRLAESPAATRHFSSARRPSAWRRCLARRSRPALYSHATKRRVRVAIDEELRERTLTAVAAVRSLLSEQQLPAPVNDSRCPDCSLINACLPAVVGKRRVSAATRERSSDP